MPARCSWRAKYAAWAEKVLAPLDDAQVQKMLLTEFGGMNEVFADLYADTSDPRWLALSHRFEHHAVTLPLKRHEDNLSGKHGNCQIPKLIGSAARYGYTGDMDDIVAASFFWDRVVRHHSYASGGHGLNEYFGPPDVLSPRVDGRAAETCNVYNMLKLTRRLFALRPDGAYADFHERALFNHILASIDPNDGRTSYMVPVGRAEQQEYQDMQRDFTCCVGSGMESHALHGLGVFYESADTIWVNLFVPSKAESSVAGVHARDGDGLPRRRFGDAHDHAANAGRVHARGPAPGLGGRRIPHRGQWHRRPAAHARLAVRSHRRRARGRSRQRIGSSQRDTTCASPAPGARVTPSPSPFPSRLHLQPTADNRTGFGDHVGAARAGGRRRATAGGAVDGAPDSPAPVPGALPRHRSRDPGKCLSPPSRAGDFTVAAGVARHADDGASAGDVSFAPFYRTQRRRYALYHDVMAPEAFEARRLQLAAERDAAAAFERATITRIVLGNEAQEAAAHYKSEPSDRPVERREGHTSRGGAGWFSLDAGVDPSAPMQLVVTYFVERGLPAPLADFEVQVDGTTVGHYTPRHDESGFYDARYEVPESLSRGKQSVTVRFQSLGKSVVVPVFAVRSARR